MKRSKMFFGLFILSLIIPVALFAQGEADPPTISVDFSGLFASAAALAAFVVAIVAFVKSKVWTTLSGWGTIAVSFGLCQIIPILGMLFKIYNPANGIMEAIGFGFSAFILASGGYKAVQQATQPKQVQ